MASKVVGYIESPYASYEKCGLWYSSDSENTLRILKEETRNCKVDNEWIIQAQEKQVEVNATLPQSLLELQ